MTERLGAAVGALAAIAALTALLVAEAAGGPAYRAEALDCAAFLEEVETEILLQRTRGTSREGAGRSGRILLRAAPEGEGIRFEAWYDSLRVWRDGPAGRLRPDTDGLIGGRWHGLLSATGAAALEVRPFLPPEVRDVADLSDVFTDFFPPLPDTALAPGARWTDDTGLEVERLADSAAESGVLERYAWRVEAAGTADTALRIGERVEDRGAVAWDPAGAPRGWSRVVTVRSQLRAGPRIAAALHSQVTQRITVRRAPRPEPCT